MVAGEVEDCAADKGGGDIRSESVDGAECEGTLRGLLGIEDIEPVSGALIGPVELCVDSFLSRDLWSRRFRKQDLVGRLQA